jgi:guanylate kinase
MARGDIFVISAPSGSGKTTICRALVERVEGISLSVSYTTRERRPGEVDGKDYHFVDEEKFDKMLNSKGFLEHARVYGRRYGTSRAAVEEIVSCGRDAVLEIDIQGGRSVKEAVPGSVLVGIFPPDRETLRGRLFGRGRDTREEMEKRLEEAEREIEALKKYDYLVVNDDLENAVSRVEWIVRARRLHRERASETIEKTLRNGGEGRNG